MAGSKRELTDEEIGARLQAILNPGLAEARAVAEFAAALPACRGCGCTDLTPCVDRRTGEACSWLVDGLCTFCVPPQLWEAAQFTAEAQAAHELASRLINYPPEAHEAAARLYAEACQ